MNIKRLHQGPFFWIWEY